MAKPISISQMLLVFVYCDKQLHDLGDIIEYLCIRSYII